MPFWNIIKSIQLLGQSQNLLNLEDCRIWMFASDFCKCCYQSHMGSLKEYQFTANGKSPEQIKTSMYQKKPNSSPILMWLWDLTSQVNVFTIGYSFHLVSHRKLWKALGLSHCGTESLLKSQGKKMPGVEESSCTQLCQMLDWKLHLYVLPLCLGIFFHAWWLCMSEPWALLWQHIKPFSGRNQGVVTSAYNRKALLHKACGAASLLCLSKTIMNNKFSGSFLHL